MAITTNERIRFGDNNFAALISASIEKSSELSAFPVTNAVNSFRSKVWKPSGYFEIDSTNQELYINDGSNKTVSITTGEYTTPSALATQIQTDLNAASSNWTVSYDDTTTPTYKFTISNSGSVTLRFSQTTNAIWSTLGYLGSSDETGTSFEADQQVNHTLEYATFDLGYNAEITFFAAISPLNEVFSLSESASTIKLMGNNINEWSSPPLTITLTRSDNGIFHFFDDTADSSYRYWRFEYVDAQNADGPNGVSFGHIYLGDYTTITQRNYNAKFGKVYVDPSSVSESENGARYFDTKTKYLNISGGNINFLEASERRTLEQLFHDFGTTTPLYVSLDPRTCATASIDELTKYVYFAKEPTFAHHRADIYSMTGLEFRESV